MTRAICIADVIIRKGKAYLPTSAEVEGVGAYLLVEPVYVVEPTLDELTEALERVFAAGNPKLPASAWEEPWAGPDPLLKAAGVRSWKALARGGASYTIEWRNDETVLYLPMFDEKGRFASGVGETLRFSPNTDIRTIAEAILEDARSRPELWK